MKVSLTWLALLLIGLAALVIGVQAKEVYEAFTTKTTEGFVVSGDLDISINTCPAKLNDFNDNGVGICSEGELVEGVCQKRVCTKGETGTDLPTCSEWLAADLDNKGRDRCPVSLPKYYETGTDGNAVKGCAMKRNRSGTGPLPNVKFCRFYPTQAEANKNADSCENQLLLEKTQCPFGTKKLVWEKFDKNGKPIGELRPYVMCDFTVPGSGIKKNCAVPDTYRNMQLDYKAKLDTNFNPDYINEITTNWKDYFCPVAKRVYLDNTVQMQDVSKLNVFTGEFLPGYSATPPPPPPKQAPVMPPKCIFNPSNYENGYPDLKTAFNGNADALKNHWLNTGMREGRSPCGTIRPDCKFTVQGYLDANPDVKNAYKGMTGKPLDDNVTGHYKVYGVNEGRSICP